MDLLTSLILILAYLLLGRLIMRRLAGGLRSTAFALLNLAGFYGFFIQTGRLPIFLAYVALVILQYLALLLFSKKGGWKPWLAFSTPILFLIFIRYVPCTFYGEFSSTLRKVLSQHYNHYSLGYYFVGISYLAFRTSHLVLEVRNGVVPRPGFWEYLGFCFFVPTVSVGPINPYSNYRRAFVAAPPEIPPGRAAMRALIGAVKYLLLAVLCHQLDYGSLLDDHYHHWMDLPVAMVFYYLYLYCNFSGFCDMAIGAAGLIGIPVPENFDNPLTARNMKEFWNRWHITLSAWMRDLVFAPLSKFLVRVMGTSSANHAIALAILATFLLIGVWHGVGWNYAAFGLAQALGVVTVHYYAIFLKKRLGRDGFKAYNENPWIKAAAVIITFCYYAATLFLFANTFAQMEQIFLALK